MRFAGALVAAGLAGAGCSSGSGGLVPSSGTVSLLDVQAQVFGPSCALADCHVSPGAPHGLDLSSAASSSAGLVGVASQEVPHLLRIEPFNPTDSYLYMKLVDDPRILGDPMPASGGPLGAADLALIEDWIDQGANP